MVENEIPRAGEHMPRELFATLFQLTLQQPWLRRRPNELYDTIVLCDDDEQKKLLVDLISRFHFRSAQNFLDDIRVIANKIAGDWNCPPQDTLLIALDDRGLADSTAMVAQQLKGPLAEYGGWKTSNFVTSLGEVVKRAKNGSHVVIVDDFCGSGGTISKKVNWLKAKLEEVNKTASIRVAIGTSMEKSKELVDPVVDDFFSVHWLQRGISDHFKGKDQEDAAGRMEKIEKKLADKFHSKKLEDYKFGWRQSEALFYLDGGNPPNNNFPIFWWPVLKPAKEREPLLPRI